MVLDVDFDRETDGRWIAVIDQLPGVMAYGRTRKIALSRVMQLANRVVSENASMRQEVLEFRIRNQPHEPQR